MGKGDQRTRRGKIFAGSFGKTRPKKKNKNKKATVQASKEAKPETKEVNA
jgi:30S ribosomal protein S31